MFVPLIHPPGHGQADFGEARAVIGGVARKAHFFVFDLPHSDACYVRAYPAATAEAWIDGHVHAFAFFGGVPQSVLYDNDRCLVSRILGGRDAQAGAALQRIPVALPRARSLRAPGQGERQRRGGGSGGFCPAQLHGAAAALCQLGSVQSAARGAVPPPPGRYPARAPRDHRRAPGAGSGGHGRAAGGALRGLRPGSRTGQLAVSGPLRDQRLLGAGGLWPSRRLGARLRRPGGDRLRRRGHRPPSPVL